VAQKNALRALFDRLRRGRAAGGGQDATFGPEQEAYVLSRAYVPEPIPCLMTGISGAQPSLFQDYLCFGRDNWLIFVGYPLAGEFSMAECAAAVVQARAAHRPQVLWFIGPEIPPELKESCCDRRSDVYYRLDLPAHIKPGLRREVRVAAAKLKVTASRSFAAEHIALTDELLSRVQLSPMVATLYRAMPDYLAGSASAVVLEARAAGGQLAAFTVVEQAAASFDAYVLGAYSQRHYVPHASDLLFAKMVERAEAAGKRWLDLGLGVNAGIRRFKEKWGGAPALAMRPGAPRWEAEARTPGLPGCAARGRSACRLSSTRAGWPGRRLRARGPRRSRARSPRPSTAPDGAGRCSCRCPGRR